MRQRTFCAAVLTLLVVLTGEARAQYRSAEDYAGEFRSIVAGSDSRHQAQVSPGSLPDSRRAALLAGLAERRQVASLSTAALQAATVAPGDIDSIVAALRAAAPAIAPQVVANLSAALPGLFNQVATPFSAPTAYAPAIVPVRPDGSPRGNAATAISTAVASIAANPSTLDTAVAWALASAPDDREVVLVAIARAFPGFADRILRFVDSDIPSTAGPAVSTGTRPPPAPNPIPVPAFNGSGGRAAPAEPPADKTGDNLDDDPDAEFADLEAEAAKSRIDDPIEPFNRMIFAINDALDTVILKPVATVYSTVTPDPVIYAVRRFFLNLNAPVIFANDLLQTEFSDAGVTLGRFAVNSTVGLLGFFEVAEGLGMPYHDADFGQTLHEYGTGDGPYLVLPVFGPSNARDGVGLAVDTLLNPLTWLLDTGPSLAVAAGKGVSRREELLEPLDELRKSSVDYYAALRSARVQQRTAELAKRSGKVPGSEYDKLFDEAQ